MKLHKTKGLKHNTLLKSRVVHGALNILMGSTVYDYSDSECILSCFAYMPAIDKARYISDELSIALYKVIPTAFKLGMSFEEINATIREITPGT